MSCDRTSNYGTDGLGSVAKSQIMALMVLCSVTGRPIMALMVLCIVTGRPIMALMVLCSVTKRLIMALMVCVCVLLLLLLYFLFLSFNVLVHERTAENWKHSSIRQRERRGRER